MATLSWYLGEKVSYIELKTAEITNDQLNEIEKAVNEKIRLSTPVTITEYEPKDSNLEKV